MSGDGKGDDRIRVLVAPHNFELGGSQINALEFAGEIARDPRFELLIYAPDGRLAERARELNAELHLSELRENAPSWRRIREIWQLVRSRKVDLVHTYEWMPTIDAAYSAAWACGVPLLSTILSMDYPYFVPKSVPLVLGTRDLVDRAVSEGRTAHLLEPPVDTATFRPDALPAEEIERIRSECHVAPGEDLVVVIGRLSQMLKLEGLLTLIESVGELGRSRGLRLAVVGDGPERTRVEQAAMKANDRAGRQSVLLLGAKPDPLPYYLAADIAVGMGGSALRALAVEKPLLVQGEGGFWSIADADSLPQFRKQGWYGVGDGSGSVEHCTRELSRLLDMGSDERAELGRFGRRLVLDDYSLDKGAARLADIYAETLRSAVPTTRQRVLGPWRLSLELVKSSASVRYPGFRDLARRATRRPRASAPISGASGGTSHEPAVSVVIPCHNYAAYLDEAIGSALEQEGVVVDVTVIDDASTDGSREIAQRWAARDGRVRVVVHDRNRGHISTFNEALEAATAPYVVKLDADDVLTPGSLRRSAELLDARPDVVFVYGGVEHVRGPMPDHPDTHVRSWKVWRGERWLMLLARRRARNPISQPEIMLRRSALQETGGHRPEVPGTSDLHLWLRLASLGNVARLHRPVQGFYRVHDASMRATIHSGLLRDVQVRRDAFSLYFSEWGDRLTRPAAFERAFRRSLARDALTNAFLELESGMDPRPLAEEAQDLDPSVRRTLGWSMLDRQIRDGARSPRWAAAARAGRDLAARLRWHRHRRFGI